MTKNDCAALKLALDQYRAYSAEHAEQIRDMLRDDPWFEVARHCAVCCQRKNLRLPPYGIMPIYIVDPDDPDAGQFLPDGPAGVVTDGRREAAKLLKKCWRSAFPNIIPIRWPLSRRRKSGRRNHDRVEQHATALADVAVKLPPEKRALFVERVTAMLTQRRGRSRPADYQVAEVTALALAGLMVRGKV